MKVGILDIKIALFHSSGSRGSPITSKGRREVAGFYAHHFLVSTALCDGGACLLSVLVAKLCCFKIGQLLALKQCAETTPTYCTLYIICAPASTLLIVVVSRYVNVNESELAE